MAIPLNLPPDFEQLPGEAFVDVKTVARLLGTTPSTVWRWTGAGRLPPPVKLSPGCTRWRLAGVRDAVAALTAGQTRSA